MIGKGVKDDSGDEEFDDDKEYNSGDEKSDENNDSENEDENSDSEDNKSEDEKHDWWPDCREDTDQLAIFIEDDDKIVRKI